MGGGGRHTAVVVVHLDGHFGDGVGPVVAAAGQKN